MDHQKLGTTNIMSPPSVPNHYKKFHDQEKRHDFQTQQPYLVYSPVVKPNNNPIDSVSHVFNSWTNKADTMARNVWRNCEF